MSEREVTVIVRNSKEVEAILAALRQAEELGEIDFPFDVQVEELLSESEQEALRQAWMRATFPSNVQGDCMKNEPWTVPAHTQ